MGQDGSGRSLELEDDPRFERRQWIFERISWVLIALVLLAALAGLLGSGPLSSAAKRDPGGMLGVEYQRFARMESPLELKVLLGPGAGSSGRVRLWVDSTYLGAMKIHRIVPEPSGEEAGADRLTFEYQGSSPPSAITLYLEAHAAGSLPGRVGLENGPEVSFSQFFYP